MAILNHNGKNIHYETYGEGKPLILLNGIMMSTKSWGIFIDTFSCNNRLILMDFLDQGQSDKCESDYDLDLQVEVLRGLINELGYDRVNIAGISYGGLIAVNFVTKYEHMVDRLVLFNTSFRSTPWLRDIGETWNLCSDNPLSYYHATTPAVYSPEFYNNNLEFFESRKGLLTSKVFADKGFMDSMIRLVKSIEKYNVAEPLKEVKTRTLIVSSSNDFIMPKEEQEELHKLMSNSEYVMLPSVGHASMYEKPGLFTTLLLGFINAKSLDMSIL